MDGNRAEYKTTTTKKNTRTKAKCNIRTTNSTHIFKLIQQQQQPTNEQQQQQQQKTRTQQLKNI